ncbi:unnamed protein product [Cuscuta europaea]|uniref:Uncharacterized protein n=2 Tax=Cuscuta europaea TaxID=41803 RepID=A0A9P0Z0E3_CUSEU|nr:unnamed protein product [Cuscuta europaea]
MDFKHMDFWTKYTNLRKKCNTRKNMSTLQEEHLMMTGNVSAVPTIEGDMRIERVRVTKNAQYIHVRLCDKSKRRRSARLLNTKVNLALGESAPVDKDVTSNVDEENTDTDDDFESPPRKIVQKEGGNMSKGGEEVSKRKKGKLRIMKEGFKTLTTRSSPCVLVRAVQEMNEKQKEVVEKIGFGSILHLQITELPSKLAYWVVNAFNPKNCKLTIADNTSVHIKEEDVECVLGFPRGKELILKKNRNRKSEILDEWRAMFQKKEHQITPSEVCVAMLRCSEGGIWFIRHFIVLVISVMLDSCQNGYVKYQILSQLENESAVKNMNWCEYTMSSLIQNRVSWEKKKDKSFTGPLVFLLVFYVDRVVLYKRAVDRLIPGICAWTTTLLRARENAEIKAGGFGQGYIDEQLNLGMAESASQKSKTAQDKEKGDRLRPETGDCSGEIISEEELLSKLAEKTDSLVTITIDIINLVQQAPSTLLLNENFNKILGTAKKLMSLAENHSLVLNATPGSHDEGVNADEVFWSNPNNLKVLDAASKAFLKRKEYTKMMHDVPTFSLGMTQEQGAGQGSNMNVEAQVHEVGTNVQEKNTKVQQGWECGLRRGDKRQIAGLRVKYVSAILCADANELKLQNLMKAREFAKNKKEGKKVGKI